MQAADWKRISANRALTSLQHPTRKKYPSALGGDLMPYELINTEAAKDLWDHTGDFFFGSDIVFANLETPIDLSRKTSLVPEVMLTDMHFNANEEMFRIFSGNSAYKGYDVLSVANNHMLDQGYEGLYATTDYLDKLGIQHCGSSRVLEDVFKLTIVERKGIKVAFLAYTFSMNKFEPDPGLEHLTNFIRLNLPDPDISFIVAQADKARELGADFIVCSLHCGNAYQVYPSLNTVELYHRIFDEAKIDVIAGGHPHNPQPGEIYPFTGHDGKPRKGFAIYSLGDFVAYDVFHWCHLPLMVKLHIGKNAGEAAELCGVDIKPVYKYGYKKRGQFHMQFIPLDEVNYLLTTDSTFRRHFKKYDELGEINRFYNLCLGRQLNH